MRTTIARLAAALLWLAGCSSADRMTLDGGDGADGSAADGGDGLDGGLDGGAGDAGRDAGRDAGGDAGRDAGGDAARDAGGDAGATDAGADGGMDAGGAPGTTPQAGELVIVEIMGNPQSVSDSDGEYIEVLNVTDRSLDLSGVTLAFLSYSGGEPVASSDTHEITSSVELAPGARAVLAPNSTALGSTLTVDYVYSGILFSNGGTMANRIRLMVPGWDGTEPPAAAGLIDEVLAEAGAFDNPVRGRGWQLSPTVEATASANDDPSNWCYAAMDAALEYRTDNWGTPTAVNDCP